MKTPYPEYLGKVIDSIKWYPSQLRVACSRMWRPRTKSIFDISILRSIFPQNGKVRKKMTGTRCSENP